MTKDGAIVIHRGKVRKSGVQTTTTMDGISPAGATKAGATKAGILRTGTTIIQNTMPVGARLHQLFVSRTRTSIPTSMGLSHLQDPQEMPKLGSG